MLGRRTGKSNTRRGECKRGAKEGIRRRERANSGDENGAGREEEEPEIPDGSSIGALKQASNMDVGEDAGGDAAGEGGGGEERDGEGDRGAEAAEGRVQSEDRVLQGEGRHRNGREPRRDDVLRIQGVHRGGAPVGDG